MRRGHVIEGSDERHMGDAEPSQEVFDSALLSVVLYDSFSSIRTYVRFLCECDHSPMHLSGGRDGDPTRSDPIRSRQRLVKKL